MSRRQQNWRSDRLDLLGSSIFSEVAAWKKQAVQDGLNVIDLGIGSPDQPPLMKVREVLSDAALREDSYAYPAVSGDFEFKQVAADWMQHRFQVVLDPELEIVTLLGSQDGLAHLAMAVCNEGDLAILPDPGYPIYAASLVLAGVKPVLLPLQAEHQYLPDLEAISDEVWEQSTFILLNYPNNPLSATADLAFFEALLAKARQHNILIVHDLAYSEMAFDDHVPPSILQVPGAKDFAVEFHSMSKSFNMAGCRIGFLAGNQKAVGALRELKANIDYGVFEPVQEAAIAALQEAINNPAYQSAGLLYERRRDLFLEALDKEGWMITPPKATMFIWAPLPVMDWEIDGGWSSRTFVQEMIRTCGVAVIPGEAFGQMGKGYIRIALVENDVNLLEAASRIGKFIRGEYR